MVGLFKTINEILVFFRGNTFLREKLLKHLIALFNKFYKFFLPKLHFFIGTAYREMVFSFPK